MAIKLKSIFNKKDLISYFLVAGSGAIVQIISGAILKDWFNLSYTNTVASGYIVAFFYGFSLTKLFAFGIRYSRRTTREIFKFILVSIGSFFITVYISLLTYTILNSYGEDFYYRIPFAVKEINLSQLFSTITGMGLSFLFNFIMHKIFTFKESGFYEKLKKLLEL